MKYAIIIPDGAADYRLEELGGKTPFEAAKKPNADGISLIGRQGTVCTTPEGFAAGSDVCMMALLGFDPVKYHTGRAPLEAAAMGIELEEREWVFRCNLVTVIDGDMADHSGGHVGKAEGERLINDFAEHVREMGIGGGGLRFYAGVGYRNLMVDGSGADYSDIIDTPPHDIPGLAIRKYLPKSGKGAKLLCELIKESEAFFAEHEINITRGEMGEQLVTHVWLWGQGVKPRMPRFEDVYGMKGAVITAVDLLAGISALIGFERLDVPGITGYHDTDYAAKGRYACDALDEYDLVCVHIEAPDEASHQADAVTKVAAIESIDEYVVGPILEKLKTFDEGWRVLYMPDHYTRVDNRKHDATPVPFCMAGRGVVNVRELPFNEANANDSDLHIDFGHELMEFFLKSGL